MEVYVDDEAKLTLHGLQQHYVKLKDSEKNRKLFELLDVLEFNQVVIFVKSVQRCMALAQLLIEQNFPAIAIHRGMTQEERLSRYQSFKDFQKVSLSFSFSQLLCAGLIPRLNTSKEQSSGRLSLLENSGLPDFAEQGSKGE